VAGVDGGAPKRLVEATGIIRELWTGRNVRHRGTYYTVNARLYDRRRSPCRS
jgi:alkanesulfonate monooxygenase SsuD/methylene tetrahydromethanopterin reductase-like flavin-dependent oxidoreductase (luciferase family)